MAPLHAVFDAWTASKSWGRLAAVWQRVSIRWKHHQDAILLEAHPELATDMARDLGLTRDCLIDLLETGHGDDTLMPAMLTQVGCNPSHIRADHPTVYRDMQRLCALCEEPGRCRDDLAAGIGKASYASYCLNAGTIAALTAWRS